MNHAPEPQGDGASTPYPNPPMTVVAQRFAEKNGVRREPILDPYPEEIQPDAIFTGRDLLVRGPDAEPRAGGFEIDSTGRRFT